MNLDYCDNEAENLYLKGAELECNNNYYDAVRYYRKALQLVPDIDVKVFRKSKLKESKKYSNDNEENISYEEDTDLISDNEDYDGTEPLIDRISRILDKSGNICVPNKLQKALHISSLPTEVIMHILKWVVSDELDLRSLDICALVCRGFYLCARDPHIWKSACVRIWKNERITLSNYEYDSWRTMFINRPHIFTNGCYIGETQYYREGERSFQDQNYRPYQAVVYYRYLRFFADGSVLMVNTLETPNSVVGQLKNKNSKHAAVFQGTYTIVHDFVHLMFKVKRNHKDNKKISGKIKTINLIYNMKFQIKKYGKWKTKLLWKEYNWSCSDEKSYEENFEIHKKRFPPLLFSRVKSYTAESENPLP